MVGVLGISAVPIDLGLFCRYVFYAVTKHLNSFSMALHLLLF